MYACVFSRHPYDNGRNGIYHLSVNRSDLGFAPTLALENAVQRFTDRTDSDTNRFDIEASHAVAVMR